MPFGTVPVSPPQSSRRPQKHIPSILNSSFDSPITIKLKLIWCESIRGFKISLLVVAKVSAIEIKLLQKFLPLQAKS